MLSIDLKGKSALVTGGSRGIGRATALLLARSGASVAISYQNRAQDAEQVVAEALQHGVRAFAEGGDLAEESNADRLVSRVVSELGGLDILVANHGIWPPSYTGIDAMSSEHWRRTIAANLDSVFYVTRAAARVIREDGRIVFVSSTAGQRGEAGHADYAASKGAMISMVKGLCIELAAKQVTVNAVAPGWGEREMEV